MTTREEVRPRRVGTVLIAWDLAPEYVEEIRRAFPDLRVVQETSPDGLLRIAPDAEVLFAGDMPREVLRAASHARWLHAASAGVEDWFHPELLEGDVVLTNSSGVHGSQIAEMILGMALCFATGLHTLIAAQHAPDHGCRQAAGGIDAEEAVRSIVQRRKFELEGQTMGVIGLGAIGDATARKAHGLGMRVLASRRHSADPPPYITQVLGPDRESLATLLRESDHVALCLPLTPETDGLIGEAELRRMQQTAYIYNVGRGASIDPHALERALAEGWIAGAGLDVTVPDPPEHTSPLWDMPNVILSQHTSGSSPGNARRLTDLFLENLRRYRAGEPLLNQIDKRLRY
ncbi:MAG TPA: D-2-hydroxyacid dehydrogenase [Chloroflexota bacterium]|jgi:phosphoglycerate dehydrogenase-like enzyme|nr:D-2-hydroxyacid dehydrogenase [Chloroflexota bacterium]